MRSTRWIFTVLVSLLIGAQIMVLLQGDRLSDRVDSTIAHARAAADAAHEAARDARTAAAIAGDAHQALRSQRDRFDPLAFRVEVLEEVVSDLDDAVRRDR